MIQFKQLKVTFDYPPDFDKHNHDLVGYVIQKYPRKVVEAAVLTRASVDTWYSRVILKFTKKNYVILIGMISIMGIVASLDAVDEVEAEDEERVYKRSHDPQAN